MYRILVGGISHETNTFSPFPTEVENFKTSIYLKGQEIIEVGKISNSVVGAYVQTLLKEENVEIIPSIVTSAIPSGVVTENALTVLIDEMLKPLENTKVDAVLLDLHGAMYSELDADADAYILERLREKTGEGVVVGATFDLHVNLTQRMLDCVDIITAYKEYPHSDMYESALKTADLTLKTLKGEISPVKSWRIVPVMASLKDTNDKDYEVLNRAMKDWEERRDVLVASITHGFYMTDSPDTHMAVFSITNGDYNLAEEISQNLCQLVWENRESIVNIDCYSVEDAYQDAVKNGNFPVVFADVCDNPGCGGTEDSVHILKHLIDVGAKNVIVGMIADSEAAKICHEAGVGATIDLQLGNKVIPQITGEPLAVRAYVKSLSDGKFKNYGPMYSGIPYDIGKTAVVVIDGISVIISSAKNQVYDRALFISQGLDPEKCDILAVKSSVHYKAAFNYFSKKNYSIEAPGLYSVNMHSLEYKNIKKDIYPFCEK